ncbi:MAG: DMT family transporter [Acetobacteraceae bacterium]
MFVAFCVPDGAGFIFPVSLALLNCLFYLALYRGYARSNGVIVLVAQYSLPLMIVLLSSLRDAQWPGRVKALDLAVGSFAFLIAVTKGHITSLNISDPISILIVLAGAFCFALMSTLSKNFVSDAFIGTFWLFFASMIGSLILMTSLSQLPHLEDVNLVSVLTNGIFINGVSYILWVLACARGDASETAALIFLSPILSAI